MLRRSRSKDGHGRGGGGPTSGIVVASDDVNAAEVMARVLEATDEPVERVNDPGSALAALADQPRRGLVVSFTGGHSTNLSLVESIRSHEDTTVRTTPIVLVTDDEKNLTFSWQSGIDEYLVRPVHADDLVAAVEAAMERSDTERTDYRRSELRKAQAASLTDTGDA